MEAKKDMNIVEAFRYMFAGNKATPCGWSPRCYLKIENNRLIDEKGKDYTHAILLDGDFVKGILVWHPYTKEEKEPSVSEDNFTKFMKGMLNA